MKAKAFLKELFQPDRQFVNLIFPCMKDRVYDRCVHARIAPTPNTLYSEIIDYEILLGNQGHLVPRDISVNPDHILCKIVVRITHRPLVRLGCLRHRRGQTKDLCSHQLAACGLRVEDGPEGIGTDYLMDKYFLRTPMNSQLLKRRSV